ncbi:MAG: type II toxin-antitoxin system RelE/ParE family toxin [Verrucomicrobia bacterium]|nr:type II toxin-antitoxin system RelE/ParE family toxin [Verrucomicrobiota bacterium]
MGRKVILSPRAIEDLGDIVRYIAQDSPDRALAFGGLLIDRVQQLADFPESGRIVPEYDNPAAREIIFRRYRIVYRLSLDGTTVEVARFWHAARGTPES